MAPRSFSFLGLIALVIALGGCAFAASPALTLGGARNAAG